MTTYSIGSYSSISGTVFGSATISFSGTLSKTDILNYLVYSATDNRDGALSLSDNNIIITDINDLQYSNIATTGVYFIKFNLSDIAGNYVNTNLKINLTVI